MLLLNGHRRAVRGLAFSPHNPTLLASCGDDHNVIVWDTARAELRECFLGHSDAVLCLTFSPDGALLASGGQEGTLNLWNVAEQRREWSVVHTGGPIVALAFSPDGETILTAQIAGRLGAQFVTWEVFTRRRARTVSWPNVVTALAFAPDGDALAIAGGDHKVGLYDVTLERPVVERFLVGRPCGLAFAPGDDRTLAVVNGRTVEMCRLPHLLPRVVCKEHRNEIHALAFAPDGRTLLTGSVDRTVRLWDTMTGREQAAYNWQVGPVTAVAVAPDGLTAAAAGHKSHIVVWDCS